MAFGEKIAQGEEVSERFRHFFAVDDQVFRVKPEPDKGMACRRFTLGDFVLVMRECKVHAAGVDVQGISQIFHRHGGALDVPARPARADTRLPKMFARLGGFPKSEVARILLLVLVNVNAHARFHPGQIDF